MKTCSRCGRALLGELYWCAGCGHVPARCTCPPNALLEDFA